MSASATSASCWLGKEFCPSSSRGWDGKLLSVVAEEGGGVSVSSPAPVPTGLVCGLEPNARDLGGEGRLFFSLLGAAVTTSGRESSDSPDSSALSISVTLLGSNPIYKM